MKNLLVVLVCIATLTSCEKNNLNDDQDNTVEPKIIGTWEVYRSENLETQIDQWTGTEWTTIEVWYNTTSPNSTSITLEFKDDGTFTSFYAGVEDSNGTWETISDQAFSYQHIQGEVSNDALQQARNVIFYCDNTFTVKAQGNERNITYMRAVATEECADSITYNVDDSNN